MAKTQFVFREGARISGADPETVGRELARIRRKYGRLESQNVLEEARAPDAPLHPVFPWDDAAAAEEHRLEIARRLIRAVYVKKPGEAARAVYHFVPGVARTGNYETSEVLAQQLDQFALALGEALKYLRSAEDRVAQLRRLADDQPEDRMAAISLAAQALSTAEQAIRTLQ